MKLVLKFAITLYLIAFRQTRELVVCRTGLGRSLISFVLFAALGVPVVA